MNTREDTHKPSTMDPAEYVEAGYFDAHPEEGESVIYHEVYEEHGMLVGDYGGVNYETRGRCDHCGAGPLRYGVIFIHTPSKKEIVVGTRCAGILGLHSKSEREHKQMIEKARIARKLAAWTAANPAEAAFLDTKTHDYGFFGDLAAKLRKYGDLSPKQTACVTREIAKAAEFAAKNAAETANAGPLPTGRVTIEGEIVSTKVKSSVYGETLKMLVKLDDGNKVWGTVPTILEEATWVGHSYDAEGNDTETPARLAQLPGTRIRFAATVEVSEKDEHFGFYKRPAKVEILAGQTGEEARQENRDEKMTELLDQLREQLRQAEQAQRDYDPADFEYFDGETEIQEAHEAGLQRVVDSAKAALAALEQRS